jgi:hypothetical protein
VRELHVVAVSEDGRHVVLAGKRGATKGGFRVALDDRLSAAMRGELPRPGDEVVPDLSPKEIQARLRNGETVERIAMSAGVPLARVERYAGPVQGEMQRIIDAARSSYLVRGRLGRSVVSLGTAVDVALTQGQGLLPEDSDWTTYRLDDGSWLVTVSWYARKRNRTASWRYEPHTKAITASDPQSAALGHLDTEAPTPAPRKRPAPAAAAQPKARRPVAKKAAPKKAVAKKAVAKKAVAKKAVVKKAAAKKAPVKKAPTKASVNKAAAKKVVAKKVVAKKVAAQKAPVTKAAAKPVAKKVAAKVAAKVVAKPAPIKKAAPARTAPNAAKAAKKAAPRKAAVRKVAAVPVQPVAAVVRPAARKPPAEAVPAKRALRVVTDLDTAAPTPRSPGKRASVPAWADVLLGTSPGGDR